MMVLLYFSLFADLLEAAVYTFGPHYGYYLSLGLFKRVAMMLLVGTYLHFINTEGLPYVGVPLGSPELKYLKESITEQYSAS